MTVIGHGVCIEPPLLYILTGEELTFAIANTNENTYLHICGQGNFMNCLIVLSSFFSFLWLIHWCHAVGSSGMIEYHTGWSHYMASMYQWQEKGKQRWYNQRAHEVILGSFTPLVVPTTIGMAKSTTVANNQRSSMLGNKRDQPYSLVMSRLWCNFSLFFLRSTIDDRLYRGACAPHRGFRHI